MLNVLQPYGHDAPVGSTPAIASDETRMRVPIENGGLKGRHGIGATFAYAA